MDMRVPLAVLMISVLFTAVLVQAGKIPPPPGDTEPPVVVLNYPPDNHSTPYKTPTFNATCTDNDDLDFAELLVSGEGFGKLEDPANDTEFSITANHTIPVELHTWAVRCIDPSGNEGSASRTLNLTNVSVPRVENSSVQNLLSGMSVQELVVQALSGNYISAKVTAGMNHTQYIWYIQSNLSDDSEMADEDVLNMSGSGGLYAATARGNSTVSLVRLIDMYLRGIHAELVDTNKPNNTLTWHSVLVKDTKGNYHNTLINETLPTIFDALPPIVTGDVVTFDVYGNSLPVNIMVTDPAGNRTGYSGFSEIPSSTYTGSGAEPEFVVIFNPLEGNYTTTVYGNQSGNYSFSVTRIRDGNVTYKRDRISVSMVQGDAHFYVDNISIYKRYADCRVYGCPYSGTCDNETGLCLNTIEEESETYLGRGTRTINETVEADHSEMLKELQGLEEQLASLESEVEAAEAENARLRARLEELRQNLAEGSAGVDRLTGQLAGALPTILGALLGTAILGAAAGRHLARRRERRKQKGL